MFFHETVVSKPLPPPQAALIRLGYPVAMNETSEVIRESLRFFISQSLNVSVQQSLRGVGRGAEDRGGEGRGDILLFTCACMRMCVYVSMRVCVCVCVCVCAVQSSLSACMHCAMVMCQKISNRHVDIDLFVMCQDCSVHAVS